MSTPHLPVKPLRIEPCGSRVTCNPPPANTDRDWLVLVAIGSLHAFAGLLANDGWEVGGSEIPDDANNLPADARFLSLTSSEDNLIITESESFYRKFMAATSVAKRLNLLDKSDRIALFQAVLYGNGCNAAAATGAQP